MSNLTQHVISNATDITQHESSIFNRPDYLLYTANGDRYIVYSIDGAYDAVANEYEKRRIKSWLAEHHPNVGIDEITISPEGIPEITFSDTTVASNGEIAAILEEFDLAANVA